MAKKTVRKILVPGMVVNIERLGSIQHYQYFVEVKLIAFGYKCYKATGKTPEGAMSNIRMQFYEDCEKVRQSFMDVALSMTPTSEELTK